MDPDDAPDENTPLILQSECHFAQSEWKPNPLPWPQLSVVLFVNVCDSLAAQSIQPYIAQRIGELDVIRGDEGKVGYYVGLMGSLYYVAVAMTVLHWNRLSDRVGRKPVLLLGMAGSMTSMLCFGLSRTFWGLVMSRLLWGLLDGNIGVAKSIVGEITDSTNRARGFGLSLVTWAIGGSIGPLIGGTLAKPNDRFPSLFDGQFWKEYPYFLPCLAVSIIILSSFLTTLFFFKESAGRIAHPGQISGEASFAPFQDKPLPLRQILTSPVILSIANSASLELLSTCHSAIVPLFFAMPVEIGGLGFAPARIGYILGAYRAFAAFFVATGFPTTVYYLGERRAYIIAVSSFLVLWILFPTINLCARQFGIATGVWTGVVVLAFPTAFIDMAFACIIIFITAAAPNKRSLGATNGLSHTLGSMARIIAPALATSLFSLSVERNILGGYAVYAVLFTLSCLVVLLALKLPDQVRPVWEAEGPLHEG